MTLAIVQARMGSQRFPGKPLQSMMARDGTASAYWGHSVLSWTVARARASHVHSVMVATVENLRNRAIVEHCSHRVPVYRGTMPEDDLLSRYAGAAEWAGCVPGDLVVRITSDCPLIDPVVINAVLTRAQRTGSEYTSNVYPVRTWPDGLDVEVFTYELLIRADKCVTDRIQREHVGPALQQCARSTSTLKLHSGVALDRIRWTVDMPGDLSNIRQIARLASRLSRRAGTAPIAPFGWRASLMAHMMLRVTGRLLT